MSPVTSVTKTGEEEKDESLDRLYRDHRVRLRTLLARRCGSSSEGEDVVHEAFARLLANYSGRRLENPLGMLYRIAVNIVRDATRSNRFRRNQLDGLSEAPCFVGCASDPERWLEARRRLEQLQGVIKEMPPRCREVYVLHKIEGLSHSEVAVTLGISRNMVERHMIRAYAQLQCLDVELDG